ncbi:MAG: hypothetical protein U0795_12525 [Pirellulales bacterium]
MKISWQDGTDDVGPEGRTRILERGSEDGLREIFAAVADQVVRLAVVVRTIPGRRQQETYAVRLTAHLRAAQAITASDRDGHLSVAVSKAAERLVVAVMRQLGRGEVAEDRHSAASPLCGE